MILQIMLLVEIEPVFISLFICIITIFIIDLPIKIMQKTNHVF